MWKPKAQTAAMGFMQHLNGNCAEFVGKRANEGTSEQKQYKFMICKTHPTNVPKLSPSGLLNYRGLNNCLYYFGGSLS